jgi:hypothetical protein
VGENTTSIAQAEAGAMGLSKQALGSAQLKSPLVDIEVNVSGRLPLFEMDTGN